MTKELTLMNKCKQHWRNLGIVEIDAFRKRIKAIFREQENQSDVLVEIYKLVFPDWERITEVEGYPEAGDDLWKFICGLFMDFDRRNHPDVMPGGMWMNTGFSVNSGLSAWEIGFVNCKVIMK